MEQRQLLNFLSICEEKHIARAADRRFITRQGLSKSLRELENELGVALFERNRKGLTLTNYGKVLEKAARIWTNQHDYILDTIKAMKEKSGSRLSVGIADNLIRSFPRSFFSGFLNAHPEIELSIRTIPSRNCQNYVLEQKLQIGITSPPIDTDKFHSCLLSKRKFSLAVGNSHPLAGRNSVKIGELRGEEAIIRHAWQNRQEDPIGKFCAMNGIKTHTRLSYLNRNLIIELLETGRYIIFLHEFFGDKDQLCYIDIEDAEIYTELFLVINKRSFLNDAADLFIAWTREKFAGFA